MNPFLLAWRNANNNAFRSWTVFLCAALMAGLAVAATIVIGGAQRSLGLALERLGADIVVVPQGTEEGMENAFLMGVPARSWMPRDVVDRVSGVPGVEAVSPQFFLSTLRGATAARCRRCSSSPTIRRPTLPCTPGRGARHRVAAPRRGGRRSLVYVPMIRLHPDLWHRDHPAREPGANGHRDRPVHVLYL